MEFQMSREIHQMQCHLLNNLRKESKFCDVEIQTDPNTEKDKADNLTAHSCILSATSFIFYKNFTVNQTAEDQNRFRIFSKGLKAEVWELVLEYIYLRKMTVGSGLSKETLGSLFWLLRELQLINEIEYKKILSSSCKIFGFDIVDSNSGEHCAIRFEQLQVPSDSSEKSSSAKEVVHDSDEDGELEDLPGAEDDEDDDLEVSRDGNDENVEKANETQPNYDQGAQLQNIDTNTTRNDSMPREDNGNHMHLPVYEANGSNNMGNVKPYIASNTDMAGACQINASDTSNQIQSSTDMHFGQGDIHGFQTSHHMQPINEENQSGNIVSDILSNAGMAPVSHKSDGGSIADQILAKFGMAPVGQENAYHTTVHGMPSTDNTYGHSQMNEQPGFGSTHFVPPMSGMVTGSHVAGISSGNVSEQGTLGRQTEDLNLTGGALRETTHWTGQFQTNQEQNAAANMQMGLGNENRESAPPVATPNTAINQGGQNVQRDTDIRTNFAPNIENSGNDVDSNEDMTGDIAEFPAFGSAIDCSNVGDVHREEERMDEGQANKEDSQANPSSNEINKDTAEAKKEAAEANKGVDEANKDVDVAAKKTDTDQQERGETELQTEAPEKPQPQNTNTSSAVLENSDAFMVDRPEEQLNTNDSFKSEWERLAGNFAFKSFCKISVLGKEDNEDADQLTHPDLIKKECDHDNEIDLVKEQGQHSITTKGKSRKKQRKNSKKPKRVKSGPWYSCSDCDRRFSTYQLFQKHQCNSDEFTKKGGLPASEDLYSEKTQTVNKPSKRTRRSRGSNSDKWQPKPITIVPDNTRYSSDIENYSDGIENDENEDLHAQVALVSFGGKARAHNRAKVVDNDDTDIDPSYVDNDNTDDDDDWPQQKKSRRKIKVTKKKKNVPLSKKKGRPFGSKNKMKRVKPLKVKLELPDPVNTENDTDGTTLKRRRGAGRPKGSKNQPKIKEEGDEENQEDGEEGGERRKKKEKKIRKRKREPIEKKPAVVKPIPTSKLIMPDEESLKGGTVEGIGANPAIQGRVARVFDVCNLCGEKFAEGGSKVLRMHQKTACKVALSPDFKDRPKNVCPFCQKQLSRNSELNIHIKIHHMGGHPYKCRLCPEEFNTRDGVKQHLINVHDVERIKCKDCRKVFLDARNYNKHFSSCGPDGKPTCLVEKPNKGCMCHICGHVSVNECKNRVHLLYHKSPAEWEFHCEVCNQAFAQKSDLKKHGMIHTGEKPYLCDLCPYATNRTSNLKLHMRKHTAEKSEVTKNQDGALVYKCIECSCTFSLKTELKDHLKIHDTKLSRCFKKFRPRTKEDMQQKAKKPGMMRKHRPKYPPKVPDFKRESVPEESSASAIVDLPTVVRDITMASLGPMAHPVMDDEAVAAASLAGMGLPNHSRAGMIAMNPHVPGTEGGGMMGIGPGPIGTEARMMGYIGMAAHYNQAAAGERLMGMSTDMPIMEDRMMQIRGNHGAVDERMHRIRNEESMLGYAIRNNTLPEAAYMNL